jgi:hypothetical protein
MREIGLENFQKAEIKTLFTMFGNDKCAKCISVRERY